MGCEVLYKSGVAGRKWVKPTSGLWDIVGPTVGTLSSQYFQRYHWPVQVPGPQHAPTAQGPPLLPTTPKGLERMLPGGTKVFQKIDPA